MTNDKDIQLRGHCPMCGGKWAVKKGYMSKHGYTVDHGWFNGVCPGQNYAPLEHDRITPKSAWDDILVQCDKLEDDALKFEQGEMVPSHGKGPGVRDPNSSYYKTIYPTIPWSEVSDREKASQLRSIVWNMRARAKGGRSFVEEINKIADAVHGKPLMEIKRDRSGPILHANHDGRYKGRYTLCGSRIEGMGMRARYLSTTEHADRVTCVKCRAEMDKPAG